MPTSNITTSQISNVHFNNNGVRDTFKFYGSNNNHLLMVYDHWNNQYIRIEDSSNTTINGFYLTHETTAVDTTDANKLVLQSTPEWANAESEPTSLTAYVNTNTINSSNVSLTDLSSFKPGQKLIVSGTNLNDQTVVVSSNVSTSSQSIYCELPDGSTYWKCCCWNYTHCRLITSMFIDETSTLTTGTTDVQFHNSNSTIKLNDESSNKLLHELRPSQSITISGTNANDGTITIDENTIPTDSGMVVSSITNNESDASGVNATINKNVLIKL